MGRSWDREAAGTGSERWQHGKLGLWEEQGWRRLAGGMLDPCPQDPSVNEVISTGLQCSGPRAFIMPNISKGTEHLPTADPRLELGRGGGRRQTAALGALRPGDSCPGCPSRRLLSCGEDVLNSSCRKQRAARKTLPVGIQTFK